MSEKLTADERKHLSRRALGLWSSESTDRPEDLFVADYVNHQEPDVDGGVGARGLDGYCDLLDGYHRGFSSSAVRILMQLAEGDLVASRWEFSATHSGEYLDRPATGRTAVWTGIQIDRFVEDKIVESWVDWTSTGSSSRSGSSTRSDRSRCPP